MSVIERIACKLGRDDEGPNVELALELAERADVEGIAEIAGHLVDRDRAVRSDCIKVLYEIGYRNPELIAPYADAFLGLLSDKQNRLVWGGMTALSTIAPLTAETLFPRVDEIVDAMRSGSVITVDHGVKTIAGIASTSSERNATLFPVLLDHLRTCRAKEVPQHAESTFVAVTSGNRAAFIEVLESREEEFTAPQAARVRKLIKRSNQIA